MSALPHFPVDSAPARQAEPLKFDLVHTWDERPEQASLLHFARADKADASRLRQEFVDGFGGMGMMYANSVQDLGRQAVFQERMENVFQFDRETFSDFAKLGKDMINGKPDAETVGKRLGEIFAKTIARHAGNLEESDVKNLMGATAGMMLAARGNFDPGKNDEQTIKLVDAMENEMRARGVPIPLHSIIWGDTKEPGMVIINKNKPFDRHNFAN